MIVKLTKCGQVVATYPQELEAISNFRGLNEFKMAYVCRKFARREEVRFRGHRYVCVPSIPVEVGPLGLPLNMN